MKFHTPHRKNITNHKPLSKFVSYVTGRKCMMLNYQLIFIIYPYLVIIAAWRIKLFIRMESGEPPGDDYVRNLQQKHLIQGHEGKMHFRTFVLSEAWSRKLNAIGSFIGTCRSNTKLDIIIHLFFSAQNWCSTFPKIKYGIFWPLFRDHSTVT